ncbi:MAG: ABC transporter permease [Actinomycetota bacterium]|nr:ABC transporter permease [Actinomycetota bacterium]
MGRFVVRRVLAMVVVMFVISLVTFLLFEAVPNGDPALRLAGRSATQAEIHQIDVKYGFNKPVYVQYAKTMKNIFTGQAYSYTQGFNVLDEIKAGLPATLSLAFGAGFIWLFISIVIGTIAAIKAGRYTDRLLTVLSMIGVSFPPFFLGAVVLYFLGYKASIFPLSGYVKFFDNPWQWLVHLILPWFTLSVLFIGFYSRVLRSTILDTINEDYIRTAKAKGLSERQVLIRHILRNSLIPIISLWGLDMAQVIGGGAILTESVFGLHGVGELARDSIGRLDIIPILVIVMLTAFAVVIMGALIDILYAFLDPRIRLG